MSQSADGLPIGVQISARSWEEELVLSVAADLEGHRRQADVPDLVS